MENRGLNLWKSCEQGVVKAPLVDSAAKMATRYGAGQRKNVEEKVFHSLLLCTAEIAQLSPSNPIQDLQGEHSCPALGILA